MKNNGVMEWHLLPSGIGTTYYDWNPNKNRTSRNTAPREGLKPMELNLPLLNTALQND